jgi:pyruvate/2-oxoglutarate dehydrogenase complex dihydrolipoamide acyltransferase (E2) component
MAVEIVMPKWGLSMQEGTISSWLKNDGDAVRQGEPVTEIETEKISNLVEAPANGILRILHPAGSVIPVTQVIAWITAPGEPVPATSAGAAPAQPAAPTLAAAPLPPAAGPERIRAMPAAPPRDLAVGEQRPGVVLLVGYTGSQTAGDTACVRRPDILTPLPT